MKLTRTAAPARQRRTAAIARTLPLRPALNQYDKWSSADFQQHISDRLQRGRKTATDDASAGRRPSPAGGAIEAAAATAAATRRTSTSGAASVIVRSQVRFDDSADPAATAPTEAQLRRQAHQQFVASLPHNRVGEDYYDALLFDGERPSAREQFEAHLADAQAAVWRALMKREAPVIKAGSAVRFQPLPPKTGAKIVFPFRTYADFLHNEALDFPRQPWRHGEHVRSCKEQQS